MRLIDTTSLTLTEYPDSRLPDYAILSHRWLATKDEVTFEDLQSGRDVSYKAGYSKLANFCSVARSKGHKYAWSDTCCIDKTSSVELGSALNSMYRWYNTAKECIAYLQGVYDGGAALQDDEWFARGWTLQELIAPKHIEFFDRSWNSLGTKDDNLDLLAKKTGIPVSVLRDSSKTSSCSIAQRMSWAAHRTTERIEDRAYSLLGIFNVKLEMIYGEQDGAFIRLQERIIQHSADQSIFAWSMDPEQGANQVSGMFAPCPAAFAHCGDIGKGTESRAFSLTNLGLTISLPTIPYDMEVYLAFLDVSKESSPASACAIIVGKLRTEGQWTRMSINGNSVLFRDRNQQNQAGPGGRNLRIRQNPEDTAIHFDRAYGIWIREITPPRHENSRICVISRGGSHNGDRVYLDTGTFGSAVIISIAPEKNIYQHEWTRIRWIKIGFDDNFQPVVMITNSGGRSIDHRFKKDFEEATTKGPQSVAHSRLFDNTWLRTNKLTEENEAPREHGWPGGFYILVHRREHWPDRGYHVMPLDLCIKFSMQLDSLSEADRGSSKYIWTVEISTKKWVREGKRKRDQFSNWIERLW